MLCFITPTSIVANAKKTSTFQAQYKVLNHTVYVSVSPSLYYYYGNTSHTVNTNSDYANFVTPQAVEPIAESLQNLTRNLPYSNERFADAVLTLVHQISYVISNPQYPVETIVDNSGDCVPLSALAASIMQAGGLDVVLILYTGITPEHMNVGVYLPYTPVYHTPGLTPTDFVYDNKTYWTAEATNAENWKVGDQSPSLAKAVPVIIPLESTEQASPSQVSSSLNKPLLPSSITISLSQEQSIANITQEQEGFAENTRALNVSGSISPATPGQTVTIYVSNATSRNYFKTVTDNAGEYTLTWNFTSPGTYYIEASCSGVSNYVGADSETLTVFVGPESFVQFKAPGYNYILLNYAQAAFATYEIAPAQGVNVFLNIPLGTAYSFSYDFTIVQAGQTASNVQTKNITIPGSTRTEIVPINVPADFVPLVLPDDFNQTINNQFCFILQNSNGNYSLNVSGLNADDISNMQLGNGSNIAFTNVSSSIKENSWYNVTESISNNIITTNLFNSNGTVIQSMVNPYNATASNEMVLLIANNIDRAVIFKDLAVKFLNAATQPPKSSVKTTNESKLLLLYVGLSILLVAAFSVALVYVRKKRQMGNKKRVDNVLVHDTSIIVSTHVKG